MITLMTQTGWDGLEKLEEELGKVASAPEGLSLCIFAFVFVFLSFVKIFITSFQAVQHLRSELFLIDFLRRRKVDSALAPMLK